MKITRMTAVSMCLCLLLTLFAGFPSVKAEAMSAEIVTVGSAVAPVRTEPSPYAQQSAAAAPNNTFLLLDTRIGSDGARWYRIYYSSSLSGWVSSDHAAAGAASSTAADPYTRYLKRVVTVTDNTFALRDKAGEKNAEVAKVSKNDRMVVLNHGADSAGVTWYEVRFGSVQGWIRRTAVKMTNICSAPAPIDCQNGDRPVIFLSPSRQPSNPYAAGNTNECEQMTRVAVELRKILEERYDVEVILSDYETPISKSGRPLKAAQQGADVYIAIHSNAGGSAGTGYGPQGYYYPGSAQSRLMAENLVNSLDAVLPFSNSSKRVVNGMEYLGGVGYGEVRDPGGYGMISILLEVEFHDHADSALWIINNTQVLAAAIADGLHDTFNFRAKSDVPAATTTTVTAAPTSATTTVPTTTRPLLPTRHTLPPYTTAATTTATTTTTTPTTTTTTAATTADTASPSETTATTVPTAAPGVIPDEYIRAGGSDRIGTAVEISRMGWNSADTVIIASGSSYPDALAGVPLSYAADAPILLTTAKNGAEEALLAEIERLGAEKAYILGGTAAVPSGTESDLTAAGVRCVRLAGSDRYSTCIKVAEELSSLTGRPFETIYFASAQNFPDALAISPVAAMEGAPILYISPKNGLPEAVADYAAGTGCGKAVLLGGTSAVSDESAESILGLGMSMKRISGSDRYATGAAIVKHFADRFDGAGAAVATGAAFPDALAGGAHAARMGIPVLLVSGTADPEMLSCAAGCSSGNVYVYGGSSAVNDAVAQTIMDAVNG